MENKVNRGEQIELRDIKSAMRVVDKIASSICPLKALWLYTQMAKIEKYYRASKQGIVDVLPLDSNECNSTFNIKLRAALIMGLPKDHVLRDLVMPANGGDSGYRKMFAVPEKFADTPLTSIEMIADHGGLTWKGGDWVPLKSSAK